MSQAGNETQQPSSKKQYRPIIMMIKQIITPSNINKNGIVILNFCMININFEDYMSNGPIEFGRIL